MTAMLDLPQQQTVVIDLRSQVQAEGTAGAVALVLAAQGQVGLEEGGGTDAGMTRVVVVEIVSERLALLYG